MLKDDDLRLLNALQIRPRASWSELSRAIGSDPVTLTRRWERLHSQGIAWIAAYRGGPIVSATALLEIECAPAQTMSVAEQIAHDPEVLTVDLTTGNRDLLVTLTCTIVQVRVGANTIPADDHRDANSDRVLGELRREELASTCSRCGRNCRARGGPGGKDSWCTRRRRGTVAAVRHSFSRTTCHRLGTRCSPRSHAGSRWGAPFSRAVDGATGRPHGDCSALLRLAGLRLVLLTSRRAKGGNCSAPFAPA